MMPIINQQLQQALEAEGLEDIQLIRCTGYFFVRSEDEERQAVLDTKDTTIVADSFYSMPVRDWVDIIKQIAYMR